MNTPVKRFTTLRTVASLISGVGYALGLMALAWAAFTLNAAEPYDDVVATSLTAGITFVGGIISAFVFIGLGKSIHVLLAIEENTRGSASTGGADHEWVKVDTDPLRYEYGRQDATQGHLTDVLAYVEQESPKSFRWSVYRGGSESKTAPGPATAKRRALDELQEHGAP